MRKSKVNVRTEWLLKNFKELRDSDKRLLLAYWEREGLVLTDTQKETFINDCTTAESITRARRALKGDYPSSKKVDDQRYEEFKDYQARYGNNHHYYF